jgi:hypothetical protein
MNYLLINRRYGMEATWLYKNSKTFRYQLEKYGKEVIFAKLHSLRATGDITPKENEVLKVLEMEK